MNTIKVPQLAWYEPNELVLPLPDSWQVEVCNMAGYNRPALKSGEIEAAIRNPIGMPPIRELAKGRREVVIIFDDMTRPTRIAGIVPSVIEELTEAGIADSSIRFIMALGAHGARDRRDFVKKLGEDTLARFPVYNHNPFANCTYVGTTTTFETKVCVNEEVAKCDLKIAIGSVVPHPMNGFGGGGKIILPGVTSFETTMHNHQEFQKMVRERGRSITGMGVFGNNPLVDDIDEAATLAGLDMLIDCLVNMWGETVAVFAGAMKPAYEAAVREAKNHCLTPRVEDKDIAIVNTFAKANEALIGCTVAYPALKPENGDIVLIANTPEGQATHYLMGPFGNTSGGPLWRKPRVPRHVNRLIVYTEYPDLAGQGWFESSDRVIFLHKWDEVIKLLQRNHGRDAKVVVYPSADIQYCA
ncbi:lactate racemase domain-containing protein [Chloroflexota bacterium]